ncbi:hypothetical protein Poli38472_013085 [Pythium oligandrum]|uniref:Bax inhibitor 1 n=1 Tax=Pythium oligandrum TaxID=41045 RepID=A0A8K1C2C6_PYTOL|nr:hypothetical protein Poli38472_013085 [Pythium oligandrum]|eukprot:TMW55194.1 hypothetical protein Poli38472_013085 [Pythium oligandrum]
MFDATSSAFSSATQLNWDLQAMLKTSGISYDVQQHLVNVYAMLSASVVCCALSCASVIWLSPSPLFVAENIGWLSLLNTLMMTAGIVWLHMEPVYNKAKRFMILMMISATMGITLSALVAITLEIDPSILVTAFLITTTVFLCFSGSAMFATRRSYLYLGGLLSSALSVMVLMNLFNYFFRSVMIDNALLYGGLVVFCAYVMFDTQMIIERASLGDKDAIKHSLDLFLDFVGIFVRIVVILLKNKQKKDEEDKRSRR